MHTAELTLVHSLEFEPPDDQRGQHLELMLDAPFTRQQALEAGITLGQLRNPRWVSRFRSVYEPRDFATDFATRCRALALALPEHAVFSGITAARLRGWWLPQGAEQLPIHVTMTPDRPVERRDVRCTRSTLEAQDVERIGGLHITSVLRTLEDLAADWSLLDLVVMADVALRRSDCPPASWVLENCTPGRRGVRTLRHAMTLADPRSESPMETLLRMSIVVPGLPAPEPQAVLRDASGGWLARVDLLGADGNSVFEFDGGEHNEPARHAADVRRWRMLRRHGFEVYPYTKHELFAGAGQIISDYETSLGLPNDPARAQAWLREWERSSFARSLRNQRRYRSPRLAE